MINLFQKTNQRSWEEKDKVILKLHKKLNIKDWIACYQGKLFKASLKILFKVLILILF